MTSVTNIPTLYTRITANRLALCLPIVSYCLIASIFGTKAEASIGDVVTQYDFAASSFVMDPAGPYMYATIPSQNAVAIINTNTLAVEKTVFVGSDPTNLAFSPDGSTAYISDSTSNFVSVFDTQSRTVINSFVLPEEPQDVVFGNQNRLFVLGQNNIFQINATSGASAGPNLSGAYIYSGGLQISPDRNSLYYGDYGISPSTLYKFNVSTTTPTLTWQTPFGSVGSNGQDLAVSHDGTFISYATGSGQNGYQIAKIRTSDHAILGSFNVGPYPRVITFSPDDQLAYAVHTDGEIDLFNTNTFLPAGKILASGQATELGVDSTGRYLFASYSDPYGQGGFTGIRVFDTGVVPEPHSTILLAVGGALFLIYLIGVRIETGRRRHAPLNGIN
jgi:YVTN family beta-propeller protein